MGEIKTKVTEASVVDFLNSTTDITKRRDSFTLLDIFCEVTGEPPKMWGASIVGFGKYHYKSERSTQEGDWPLTGFSPRKQKLTLYIMPGFDNYQNLLEKLGKHKTSVSCLYIKKLSDIDQKILRELIEAGYRSMKKAHL
jgi:hypothetical protein